MSETVEAILVRRARKTLDGVPADVAQAAMRSIADCMGVGLSASTYGSVKAFIDGYDSGRREKNLTARSIGTGIELPTSVAATANAMACHIHDFDDDDPVASLAHPTGVVFNAALAVGDAYDLDSKTVLLAHIAGVETMMRLGLVANPDHYNSGWHATASLGIFGATVAAGLLMGLNDEELEHALGIAASMATGLKGNFGSDMKPLQVGLACGNGVTAAQLAAKGIRSASEPLFGKAGFLATAGSKRDPRPIIEAFGEPYGLVSPGLNIKIYPCCSSCHTPLDGLLGLIKQHGLSRNDIALVKAFIGKDVPKMLFYDVPNTGLEGKFSLKYCLAAALKSGAVTLEDFDDKNVVHPSSREAMNRVEVHVDDSIPVNSETGVTHQSKIEIRMRSGETYRTEVIDPRGSPHNPISEDEIRAKFVTCSSMLGDPTKSESVFNDLMQLDAGGSIRSIAGQLAGAPQARLASARLMG